MAIKYKLPSTEDALNMEIDDLMVLSRSQLARVVSRISDTANKRIERMDKKGIKTSASARAKKGGKFSVKGKTQIELIQEYQRAKQFLTAKTGGIKKSKSTLQKTRDTLKEKYGVDTSGISDADLLEMFKRIESASLSDEIQKLQCSTILISASKSMKKKNKPETTKKKLQKLVRKAYEEIQQDDVGSKSPAQLLQEQTMEDDIEGDIFT